jgi:hypothetical protein
MNSERSLQVQLGEIKEVDLLVGIPSYNNVRTIGHVVRTVIGRFGQSIFLRKEQ